MEGLTEVSLQSKARLHSWNALDQKESTWTHLPRAVSSVSIRRELWASSFGVRTHKFILLLAHANQGAARGLLGKGRGCREKGWGIGVRQGAWE